MRLITSGNELLDYAAEGWDSALSTQPSPIYNQAGGRSTPQGFGGLGYFYFPRDYGLSRQLYDPTNPEGPAVTKTELYGRFAIYGFGNTGGQRTIMHILDNTGAIMFTIWMVDYGQPNTGIQIYRGDPYVGGSSNFVGSSTSFDRSTWSVVEWHIKTGAVGGLVEVRINGGPIASFSGDVRGLLGQTNMAQLWIVNRTVNNATQNGVDDFVINDTTGSVNNTWPGDGYVIMLSASRDGTLIGGGNQLTNDRGTSTGNFSSVKLQPGMPFLGVAPDRMFAGSEGPSIGATDYDRTYVYPTAVGQKDSYKLNGPLPLEFAGVRAVRVLTLCSSKDNIFGHVTPLLEFSGPNEQLGTVRTLPRVAPAWVDAAFNVNPATSSAWLLSDLNALEFGAKFTA